MALNIQQNDVMLGGEVQKCDYNKQRGICRIHLLVPIAQDSDEKGKDKAPITITLDVVEPKAALASTAKPGDFFSCRAFIVKVKVTSDEKLKVVVEGKGLNFDDLMAKRKAKDRDAAIKLAELSKEAVKYDTAWLQANNDRPIIIIPDGGKYAKAALNEARFQGRVMRISDLRDAGKTKMCFVTLVYNPPGGKNETDEEKKKKAVFLDIATFGGTAEKYVKPYLAEGDTLLATGQMETRKEKWTVNGQDFYALTLRPDFFQGVQFETPQKGAGGNKASGPNTTVYENGPGGDDDLPF
jgi:single-stranded DNA-binding protein